MEDREIRVVKSVEGDKLMAANEIKKKEMKRKERKRNKKKKNEDENKKEIKQLRL